jgi:hypothetical protein
MSLWYSVGSEILIKIVGKGERVMNKEELLERMNKIKVKRNGNNVNSMYKELRKIALEIDADDLLKRFIDYCELDSLFFKAYEIKGLITAKDFLDGVNNLGNDVYYLNNRGYARDVSANDLYALWLDLRARIKKL